MTIVFKETCRNFFSINSISTKLFIIELSRYSITRKKLKILFIEKVIPCVIDYVIFN